MNRIERSPGLPISASGLRAGGGEHGATETLDSLVQEAAEALSDLYGHAPVTIRFNSDRRSGGAWLKTAEPDYIGGNAEVGITAFISPDDSEAVPVLSVSMRRVSRVGDDWETDFAEREGGSAGSVDEAIDFIRERAVTDFGTLTGRLDVLAKKMGKARQG